MKILIVGTGYVGLVSGACFADLGHEVVCVDNDFEKIKSLTQGEMPFFEPGLKEVVLKNQELNRLKFSQTLTEHLNQAQIIFIAVGTPPKESGQADLSYVYQVVEEIGRNLTKYCVIVTKSTVPVGTNRKIKALIKGLYQGEFDVASCPEFLREGTALSDFINADRVVIGTESESAKQLLLQLHEKIDCPKISTNLETAEMVKYASNSFLATKISFINEIANVCEMVGADVEKVAEGMGLDKRIGQAFLRAGVGYGGSCFPKDVRALHHIAGQLGYPFQLMRSVIEVNNQQRWNFYKKINNALGSLEKKTIGVWGLAFKANTDDIRDSIAVDLIEKMVEDGAKVKVYDPQAMKNSQKVLGNKVEYCFTPECCAIAADCLVIMTDWDEFKNIDLSRIKISLKEPLIFDGRNCYDPQKMKLAGFKYFSIGR